MEANGMLVVAIFMLPGIYLYVMNWAIFINNVLGKKWSSNVPPLGGLIIAVAFLLTPYKIFALIGLTDPGLWLIFYALFVFLKESIKKRKNDKNNLKN